MPVAGKKRERGRTDEKEPISDNEEEIRRFDPPMTL
jgi:hypothetical protein